MSLLSIKLRRSILPRLPANGALVLADNSVGGVKIANNSVTPDKLSFTLGSASLLNVGTTTGTVAAGDDPRFGAASSGAIYATRALAILATIPAIVTTVGLSGFFQIGDAPFTTYTRVASQPTHPGKFQSADGAWWEIRLPASGNFDFRQFGCKCDLTTDDLANFQNGLAVSAAFGYASIYVPAPGMQLGTSANPMNTQTVIRTRIYASDPFVIIALPGNSSISFFMTGANGFSNGGFDNITLWATVDRTTGQALRLDGDLTGQPDEVVLRNIRITGVGTWNIGLFALGVDRPRMVPTIVNGGTGYTVGNTLTAIGGTGAAATLTVTSVAAGVITGVTFAGYGAYTVDPTNPVSVTGGSGTGATFNFTKYAVGIRRLTVDGCFIGACSALAAYFDTISELHLIRPGIYGAGVGGNIQITSTNNLESTAQVNIIAANIAGNVFLGRVSVLFMQGNFGSVSPSANSTRCKGIGAVGAAIVDLGTSNNFTLLN